MHAVIRRWKRHNIRDRLRLRVGSLSLARDSVPVINGDAEQVSANTHRPYVMQLCLEKTPHQAHARHFKPISFVHSKTTCLGCYSRNWTSALCQVYPAVRQVSIPPRTSARYYERLGYMTTPPMVARGGVHGASSFV